MKKELKKVGQFYHIKTQQWNFWDRYWTKITPLNIQEDLFYLGLIEQQGYISFKFVSTGPKSSLLHSDQQLQGSVSL